MVLISTSVQQALTRRQPSSGQRRSGMSNALYAALAMALVTSVGAGVAIHVMDSESPENLVTVEGTVTAVDWNPHFNESVELTLTTANGTNYSVALAPPWWWAEQNFPTIHVNDTLKVEGTLDDGHEIEAFTVWINGGDASVPRAPGDATPRQGGSGQ